MSKEIEKTEEEKVFEVTELLNRDVRIENGKELISELRKLAEIEKKVTVLKRLEHKQIIVFPKEDSIDGDFEITEE